MSLECVGFLCSNGCEGDNWLDLGENWQYFVA